LDAFNQFISITFNLPLESFILWDLEELSKGKGSELKVIKASKEIDYIEEASIKDRFRSVSRIADRILPELFPKAPDEGGLF
jgi:hypothetical protein